MPDCVEILFESDLGGCYAKWDDGGVLSFHDKDGLPHTVMGFKYRIARPRSPPGSLAVITRTEILFKYEIELKIT